MTGDARKRIWRYYLSSFGKTLIWIVVIAAVIILMPPETKRRVHRYLLDAKEYLRVRRNDFQRFIDGGDKKWLDEYKQFK